MSSGNLSKSLAVATTHDVLRAAKIIQPDIYIPNEKVHSENVGGVVKVVICSAVSKVPGVGSLFSGLLRAFWPDSSTDIWESMKAKVEALVDEKIDENNAQQLRDKLQGLYLVLDNYSKQPPSVQAQRFPALLNVILHDAPAFINDKSPWRSLPYFVFFGTLYLSALWTQWKYCRQIDGCEDAKQVYREDLKVTVERLVEAVKKLKEDCIDRRKKHITVTTSRSTTSGNTYYGGASAYSVSTTVTHVGEDQHTHVKFTLSGDESSAEKNKAKILQQLHYEVDSKYAAELDKILEPTRLWWRYTPDREHDFSSYQHLEYPKWLWDGISSQTKWYDTSEYYRTFGEITKIVYHHGGSEANGVLRIWGIDISFGGRSFLIGARRGYPAEITLETGEVITGASAKGSSMLQTVGFNKAHISINNQGRMEFYNTWTNTNEPDTKETTTLGGLALNLLLQPQKMLNNFNSHYDGRGSSPHPTRMLHACGWHVDHPTEGFVGTFQPVFGCWEKIDAEGRSTWS